MINESEGQTGALDRVAARVERDLKKAIQVDLPVSFDVDVYVDYEIESLATGQTEVTVDGVNTGNPTNYYFVRARSRAGHHDHFTNPEIIRDNKIRQATIQNLFQAQIRIDHPNINSLTNGSVWSCTLLGGELVRLDSLVQQRAWRFDGSTRQIIDPTKPSSAFRARRKNTAASYNAAAASATGYVPPGPRSEDQQLYDLIALHESRGNYNAANVIWYPRGQSAGGSYFKIAGGATENQTYNGKLLTELTIGEVKAAQAHYLTERYPLSRPPNTWFAMGRYQIIPATMLKALESTGFADSNLFNEDNQDEMMSYLIYEKTQKTKSGVVANKLGDYLLGKDNATVEEAIYHLAKEFSSVPKDPSGAGARANENPHNDYDTVKASLELCRKVNIEAGRKSR